MIIFFILSLALIVLAIIFAVQNMIIISLSFLSWQLEGSLALILTLSVLMGILICLFLILPGKIKDTFKLRNLKKEITKLEEELRKQKELTVFAKTELPTKDDIEKIEKGAIAENVQ